MVEEIKAGRIDHALVFAYDHCRTGLFIPPASTAQVTVPGTANSHGIPMGGRIQLDPAWDVEQSGLFKMVPRTMYPLGVPQQPSDFRIRQLRRRLATAELRGDVE